ncbi:MAG: LemA family protein [Lentisphaeria bacterium]|nr:LemA family protein [Lentisphaeria bacterium]
MVKQIDRRNGPVASEGNDVNVIMVENYAEIGVGSTIFEICIFAVGFVPALLMTLGAIAVTSNVMIVFWLLGIVPGGIYWMMKMQARNFFNQLDQKIQEKASEIDNYMEQRVVILDNVARLVEKATTLDQTVMTEVAALRGGGTVVDDPGAARNERVAQIDRAFTSLVPHLEAYPELRSHEAIASAMRQNSYLQKEITAARTMYNNTVALWNRSIFDWPVKQIVAARSGYRTIIPFAASQETKERARATVF